MLNTRNEEKNTAFYSYIACFVNRELPLGSQSHFRISSLCVCARVPFVLLTVCEYIHLAYARIRVINRVDQAEYVIHIRVVAPQEYVNIYSTCRTRTH